ncbi:MAG: T9SS type A sorting domain-containing protein [Bacteroidia bacterium]
MKFNTILNTALGIIMPMLAFAQDDFSYAGDIGVNIQTQMSDSWELTGNMTIQKTVWRGNNDIPEMVFHSADLSFDKMLATELENLRTPEVALTGFSAKMEGEYAAINWTSPVSSEVSGFGIERSLDGNTWEKIGEIRVKTTDNNLSDFSFTDPDPVSGTNYYRLRQENRHKKAGFSDVIALESLNTGWHVTYLFPNPMIFGTAIELYLYQPARVRIVIDDPNGHPIGTVYSQYTSMGSHQIELKMDNLPKGEYICRISIGDQLALRKIRK